MLTNYFKIAFRSLLKNRVYSFINIFGLTIGIVSVVLIMMYVTHENSYDEFHKSKENLYKVTLERKYPTYNTFYGIIPHSFAQVMSQDFPEIKEAVRVLGVGNQLIQCVVSIHGFFMSRFRQTIQQLYRLMNIAICMRLVDELRHAGACRVDCPKNVGVQKMGAPEPS